MPRLPPIVSFVAPSGTGKTTLIEGVLAALAARGLRVGVLKHDAHRLDLDKPGKDTWRFRRAGAWRAVIASQDQLAVFSAVDGPLTLAGLVDSYLADCDLVITEGFRRASLPALRVHRAAHPPDPAWQAENPLVAWVSDEPVATDLPVLPLDDPAAVADFLTRSFLPPTPRRHATGVVPVGPAADPAEVARTLDLLRRVCDGRVLAVTALGAPPPPAPAVSDLRPGLGPLGALLTALASVDTPDVLFVGVTGLRPTEDLLRALLERSADVVVPVRDGFREPCVALYGHRCLSAIQGALLGGEARMDGWWGAVRVATVPTRGPPARPRRPAPARR